jgi:hypothetical protein
MFNLLLGILDSWTKVRTTGLLYCQVACHSQEKKYVHVNKLSVGMNGNFQGIYPHVPRD